MSAAPNVHWTERGEPRSARWRSEAGVTSPARIQLADDTLSADAAYRLASEGNYLLWRGDFQNARQLLQALARRFDRKPRKKGAAEKVVSLRDAFNAHRQAQSQRARILGSVLIEIGGDYAIALRRAPDLRTAMTETWGAAEGVSSVASMRELLGIVGAHEWRSKGVEVPALGEPPNNRIHPHYGVFSPVRGEYLSLVAKAPLPSKTLAFDIGTGTGVLAAILARRGVARVVATDMNDRALACAEANVAQLGLADRVQVVKTDLFPEGQAPLILCNPPWLPARPATPLEHAVYDENSRMLRGFLGGLAAHLTPDGEGWLILSDLAELLGLRAPGELAGLIDAAGLRVVARLDARPLHPKAADASDPLHAARSRELTTLWRLATK